MPKSYDQTVTVRDLLADGANIFVSCRWCGKGRRANLARILERKGPDTLMLDRLPLCSTPGCLGVRRFRDMGHTVQGFLMSARGETEFAAHHEWLNRTHVLIRRRDIVVAKTMDLPKID